VAGGLMARNNAATGADAAPYAVGMFAIVLLPGWVGVLIPLADAHRVCTPLAASLGASDGLRVAVFATTIAGTYVAAALIATLASGIVVADVDSLVWIAAVATPTAIGASLVATRLVLRETRATMTVAVRALSGAVLASATAVVALASFGNSGALAVLAAGVAVFATVKP
jgi:hypothetical protein